VSCDCGRWEGDGTVHAVYHATQEQDAATAGLLSGDCSGACMGTAMQQKDEVSQVNKSYAFVTRRVMLENEIGRDKQRQTIVQ